MHLEDVYMADVCPQEESGEFLFLVLSVKVIFSSQPDSLITSLWTSLHLLQLSL